MKPFLDIASLVWAMPEEQWIDDMATEEDITMLKRESISDSIIDKVNFRQQVLDMWHRKQVELKVRELPGRTRVVFLGTEEQWLKIPWQLWARIFQGIGHPVGRILFYAHPSQRELPSSNSTVLEAKHINGGYTNLGLQEKIVIYRYEEATRVLLHELLHTAGLDAEKDVTSLEANTEAWAEIFLCAMLSKGHSRVFSKLWNQQCSWILAQTLEVETNWSVNGPNDYAWRYLVGKKDILEGLGFMKGCTKHSTVPLSLRFTTPEWDTSMI